MDEKPQLSVVLDHYDIVYRPGRVRQKICCPVHDEKEPSCSIDLEDDWFNCHACHAGGDAYSLIMLKEGIDFAEAKNRAGVITGNEFVQAEGGSVQSGIFGPRTIRRSSSKPAYRPRIFQ